MMGSTGQHLNPSFETNRHAVGLGTENLTLHLDPRCIAPAALALKRELDENGHAGAKGGARGEKGSARRDVFRH